MRLTQMITAVDAHAAGEPGRVIIGGVVDVPGATMYEKKVYLERHADGLRKRMLREPRGYPALCCNVILPPTHPDADAGFVIMEQTEYPPMSGSNTICVATVLIETGIVEAREPVTELVLESPAGLIPVRAQVLGGKVTNVTFENVPAFAFQLDAEIDVPDLGPVRVDVAYGGMFYVIAEAERFGLSLVPEEGGRIARIGAMLTAAAREQLPAVHPEDPQIAGVSISQLTGPASDPSARAKNAVTVSTGAVDWARPETWRGALDRSPCGTGTCARMAALHARGQLAVGEDFPHEGILGTIFTGRIMSETRVGDRPAVVTTLSGRAWITGISQYVVDTDDPFPEGFTVGDIWG
ncbi:MAG: proline racemase family protein [Gemmatimonadales bacterium]|jgi:proline racemase